MSGVILKSDGIKYGLQRDLMFRLHRVEIFIGIAGLAERRANPSARCHKTLRVSVTDGRRKFQSGVAKDRIAMRIC